MQHAAPYILTILAVIIGALSFWGDDSYSKLNMLRQALEKQVTNNRAMDEHVGNLKHEVWGLQKDDRALEKVARNELGMVKKNEILVVFEKDAKKGKPAHAPADSQK